MNESRKPERTPKGQFLVYTTEDGRTKIDVRLEGETVWLTQADIAESIISIQLFLLVTGYSHMLPPDSASGLHSD